MDGRTDRSPRECMMGRIMGQPNRSPGANLATLRRSESRVAVDGPRQFQQVFIGLRFLLGFTKEESRKPVGSFSVGRLRGDGEISAIEILGSLNSQDGRGVKREAQNEGRKPGR